MSDVSKVEVKNIMNDEWKFIFRENGYVKVEMLNINNSVKK